MYSQFDVRIANIAEGPLDPEKNLCFPQRNCDIMSMPYGKISTCNNKKKKNKLALEWYNPYAIKLLNYILEKYSQEPSYIDFSLGGKAIWDNLKIETYNDGNYLFDKIIITDIPLEGDHLEFHSKTMTVKKKIKLNNFQKYVVNELPENINYNNEVLTIRHINIYKCILMYNLIANLKFSTNYTYSNSMIEKIKKKYVEVYKLNDIIKNPRCENFIITHGPIFDEQLNDIVTHKNISNKPDEAIEPPSGKYQYNINFMPWQLHDRNCL